MQAVVSPPVAKSRYSVGEEIANTITHALGILLAVGGLCVLIVFASLYGNAWHIVSCSIYGATQVLLYTTSTLYHGVSGPRAKSVLRLFDHSAIFLLIAGTYTPFTLVNLRGPWGWTLFGVIWSMAIIGIALQGFLIRQKALFATLPYIAMGWAVVVGFRQLVDNVAVGGLRLLVAGGLAYTLGCVFYAWRKLPYHHAVWHLFVLAGSTLHFFAILFYVIPLAN